MEPGRRVIAQVVAPGQVGGVETVVSQLLRAQRGSTCPMDALLLLPPHVEIPSAFSRLADMGVRVQRIDAPHRAYWSHYQALRAALRAFDVRVMHSHGYHADILCSLLASITGRRHVATLHGFIGSTRRGRLYESLQLRMLRRADAVIAVADTVAERASAGGVPPARIHVIRNPAPSAPSASCAEARTTLGIPPASAVLGWVGRMSAEKNPLGFLELLAGLPGTFGVMLGDGPLREVVAAEALRLGVTDRLLAPGAWPESGTLMRAFDVLAITSHTEGTPMVALEAMRAEVPVVSTAVGGVPRLLREGAGVVVPVNDAQAMASAVDGLLIAASQRATMVQRATARIEAEYSIESWWRAHQVLYGSSDSNAVVRSVA